MSEVGNEQAMIIGLVTDDANASASAIRRNIGVVDADVDLIIVRVDEARALSSGLVNVLDKDICWVSCLRTVNVLILLVG